MTRMADDLVLKVKFKSGQMVLNNLRGSSTVAELINTLIMSTGTSNGGVVRVLSGFPLKRKDMSNPLRTLHDLGIRSGDTLIIEEPKVEDYLKRRFHHSLPPSHISMNAGVLMKRVVPADNSCLFTSVYFLISDGIYDSKCAKAMRKIIAEAVKADPSTYTEAFLGKSNSEYRHWILGDETWGGAIEISILSAHFGIELAVVDAQTARVDRFGEDKGYHSRGFLFYDGIHYDPLVFSEQESEASFAAGKLQSKTNFASDDHAIMQMAIELGSEAKNAKKFTDVNRFVLKCLVCYKGLRGQDEALEHAKETGHANFGESVS